MILNLRRYDQITQVEIPEDAQGIGLKMQIFSQLGINPHLQILVHQDRRLHDEEYLTPRIMNHDTIDLLLPQELVFPVPDIPKYVAPSPPWSRNTRFPPPYDENFAKTIIGNEKLPFGWREALDTNGKKYYISLIEKRTTWNKPQFHDGGIEACSTNCIML